MKSDPHPIDAQVMLLASAADALKPAIWWRSSFSRLAAIGRSKQLSSERGSGSLKSRQKPLSADVDKRMHPYSRKSESGIQF